MPIDIIRNDLTQMYVDAIVNATDTHFSGSGGIDAYIHRSAGSKLMESVRKLIGCKTGQARITDGFGLPCKYVIHTAGPVWKGGAKDEAQLLAACYRSSLELAREKNCLSIAFPLISTGTFGYPREQALRIAVDTIRAFLEEYEMLVYIVVFDRDSYLVSSELFSNVRQFIDDHYVEEHTFAEEAFGGADAAFDDYGAMFQSGDCEAAPARYSAPYASYDYGAGYDDLSITADSLDEALGMLDESFSQMLLRKIDECGIKDAECYRRANVDRRLFSKIRGDVNYRPSKRTAVAFAIALRLTLDETRDMLYKAGYALSRSSKFDVIIEYAVRNHIYDVDTVNQILFDYDQQLLGG